MISNPILILLFHRSRKPGLFHVYKDWHRDAHSMYLWALEYLPGIVTSLHGDTFYTKAMASLEPWLIYFYVPECETCQQFSAVFETVALYLKDQVHIGKLNCYSNDMACHSANVYKFPDVRLYPGCKTRLEGQPIAGVIVEARTAPEIISYVKYMLPHILPERHDEL